MIRCWQVEGYDGRKLRIAHITVPNEVAHGAVGDERALR
jgi:hypothetical protein